ncbi:hypothetical protein CVT24_005021 [Panaeolus cyanescens]|uniref:DUF6533 domain-containing protein n=1 Tax=Panaeolus cyanescens TaxID=181874 RepID=A0A409YB80_9AGAR|nr:hypothetical protein CVT24_005021 [Panaeolus cyanescens]
MDARTAAAAAAQFQALIKGLYRVQLVTSFDLIAASVLIYDWFLTFEMEVALVWKSNWNFMKVLFLLQRYMPFADTVFLILYLKFGPGLGVVSCKRFYAASGYMMATGTALSELILTLRVWAVWHRDPRLTIFLPLVYLGCWIPIMYFMYVFLQSLVFTILPGNLHNILGNQCFIIEADRIFYMVWVLLIILEAYKAGGDSALYQTVYRDGAIYYLYLFALSTLNIIVIRVLPHGYENLLTGIERCVHSMLTSRVLLHIRAHARSQDNMYASKHWADGVTDLPMVNLSKDEPESRAGTTSHRSIVIQRTQVVSERVL